MTSNSLLSTKLLYRLNSKGHRNKTLLHKGFTLVELMVVIVIVGILSAVALPGFLSQAVKAKGTEAKSDISAIIKNAAAEYQSGGAIYVMDLLNNASTPSSAFKEITTPVACDGIGGKAAATTTKFDYTCALTTSGGDYILAVKATGDGTDTSLGSTMTVEQDINLDTGAVSMDKANTCKVFGGTKTC